jgi:SH3-like domain-containing protein
MNKILISLIILAVIITVTRPLLARSDNNKLPIPRFAAIKSNEVNARVGPTIKSPIEWVFIKKGEPVEIIAEYEQWRQIRDIKGEGGWVHSSVLSGKRSVIIVGQEVIDLTKALNDKSKIVAKVSKNARCFLNKCKENYCQINCKNYTGWLAKEYLWGVYQQE